MAQDNINLEIEFTKPLTEEEESRFWKSLILEIEKLNLKAGGGNDSLKLSWVIDYSESALNKKLIMNKISEFLDSEKVIILKYKMF